MPDGRFASSAPRNTRAESSRASESQSPGPPRRQLDRPKRATPAAPTPLDSRISALARSAASSTVPSKGCSPNASPSATWSEPSARPAARADSAMSTEHRWGGRRSPITSDSDVSTVSAIDTAGRYGPSTPISHPVADPDVGRARHGVTHRRASEGHGDLDFGVWAPLEPPEQRQSLTAVDQQVGAMKAIPHVLGPPERKVGGAGTDDFGAVWTGDRARRRAPTLRRPTPRGPNSGPSTNASCRSRAEGNSATNTWAVRSTPESRRTATGTQTGSGHPPAIGVNCSGTSVTTSDSLCASNHGRPRTHDTKSRPRSATTESSDDEAGSITRF